MGVCPVCGCKTDELDFVSYSFSGSDEKICSFCEKQLKAFDSGSATKSQLRWLASVNEKQPAERSAEIGESLARLLRENAPPEQPAPVPQFAAVNGGAAFAAGAHQPSGGAAGAPVNGAANESEQIDRLNARISDLEKKVDKMKKAQIIRNVLEIVLPIILFLLIILVFFASGLYDNLRQIFDIVNEYMSVKPAMLTRFLIG